MGIRSDLRTLYHVLLKPIRGHDHAARMSSFYTGQAEDFDRSRRRWLPGRAELWQSLEVPRDGVWVDLGGGTGANFEHLGERIGRLRKAYIVELAEPLLEIARRRVRQHGWGNVEAIAADATGFAPPVGPADVVTFCYSLSMMPDWFAALENAWAMLRAGGRIGVVDYYVSRKHPAAGFARHRWFARTFWPICFARVNVFLSPDHVPFLHRRFEPIHFSEHRARMPYVPLLWVPYYRFIGRKPSCPP